MFFTDILSYQPEKLSFSIWKVEFKKKEKNKINKLSVSLDKVYVEKLSES